jgi:hypothetical protein
VGIGTTAPSEKLQVDGSAFLNSGVLKITNNSITNYYDSSQMNSYGTSYDWKFSGANVMRITSTGNVGIGTTSPSAKLHLADSTSGGNPSFILQDNARSGAAALNYISLTDSLNTNQAKIGYLSGLNTELTLQNLVGNTSLVSSSQMKITAGTNTIFENSGSEKMRITNTGSVGIGTTSPSEKLEVSGNVKVDKGSAPGRTAYLSDDGLYIGRLSAYGGGYPNNIIADPSNSNNLDINARARISLKLNTNTVLIANDSGNVGIGTTNPGYALHVDPVVKIGDRQGTDGSLILQSQQGPNITFTSSGNNLNISGSTGSSNGNMIRLLDEIKIFDFANNIGGTIRISRGNRGLMDTNIGGYVVQQQNTTGSNGRSTFLSTDSSGTILRSTSYGSIGTSGDIQFQFGGGDNSSEPAPSTKMIIKNDGNVGIGTTSPSEKLHIEASDPRIKIVDTDGTNWESEVFTQGGALKFQARNGTNFGNISFQGDNGTTQSEYARFNSVGNFGIGTTSPQEKLDISSGSIRIDDYQKISWSSSDSNIGRVRITGSEADDYIAFATDNSDKVRINNTGVGIGTTSPSTKLHVQGAASGYLFRVQGTSTLNVYDPGAAAEIGVGSGSGDKLKLFSNDSLNNGITIDTSGNVGIGTTSPSHKLDVAGDIKLTNSNSIYWRNAANNADIPLLNLSSTNIFNVGTTSSSVPVQIALHTAGSERMRIDSSGNVGINDTNPTKKLQVNGQTKFYEY